MSKNSFKELEELEMKGVSMRADSIKKGITSDIGFMKYIASITELYFPRIIDLIIGLAGGSPNKPDGNAPKSKKYPDM